MLHTKSEGAPAIHTHDRPLRVYWEITRACDLACRHCRAEAIPTADPRELTTQEAMLVLDQLAAGGPPHPHVVLTGGDPLKRQDLWALIEAGRRLGLHMAVAPSATPLLTVDALRRMRAAGVEAISLSLDGSDAVRHDAIRQVPGTYERTVEAAAVARQVGLPFQVNTLVCEETVDDLAAIYEQVIGWGAARWSLFFLVTVGRGHLLKPVSPARAEAVLSWAAVLQQHTARHLMITTTEAPQLRRVMAERAEQGVRAFVAHAAGVRDGNGVLFISHTGEICPSGFLEIPTGNVRQDDVIQVYRTAPLFRQLRDVNRFGGRCGVCEYRGVCGGSRARAFSATGDALAEDPLCTYVPLAMTG